MMNAVKTICAVVFVVFFVTQVFSAASKTKEGQVKEETPVVVNETQSSEVLVNADLPTETPVVEIPADAAVAVEVPVVEIPAAEVPAVEDTVVEIPLSETPVADISTDPVEATVESVEVKEIPAVETPLNDEVNEAPKAEEPPVAADPVEAVTTEAVPAIPAVMQIPSAPGQEQPSASEEKEFSDQEIMDFMKEYIVIQAQSTGSFDLYDEKIQKMRHLEFIKLGDKIRRYGVIGISTAEFTDKDSGETVQVDVNTRNKGGLSVTVMRIKSVTKPVQE